MAKIKQPKRKGIIFIISGPSGCGKTTLGRRLVEEVDNLLRSVSLTTRPMRLGEKDKEDYIFTTKKDFLKRVSQGKLLEWTNLLGSYYGTPKEFVLNNVQQGKDVLLIIDVQGALKIKKSKTKAVFIFILPPSLKILEQRLKKRRLDSQKIIKERIKLAKNELGFLKEYDYKVVNDNLNMALEELRAIIIAERCRLQWGANKAEGKGGD